VSPLALVGVGAFLVAGGVVGVRMLWLYARTRRSPELLLGLGLLGSGAVGVALEIAVRQTHQVGEDSPWAMFALTLVPDYLGAASLALFGWRVFLGRERWGTGVAILVVLGLAGCATGELLSGQWVHYLDGKTSSGPWIPLGLAMRGLVPALLSALALRSHRMMRRRMRIGLAEPLVANRVLLWGVATLCSALAHAVATVHRCLHGAPMEAHLWAVGLVSLAGLLAAGALALAFFPPRAYERWVESRR